MSTLLEQVAEPQVQSTPYTRQISLASLRHYDRCPHCEGLKRNKAKICKRCSSKPRHAVIQPEDSSKRFIPLTQGQVAVVDACDYNLLSKWTWYAIWNKHNRRFYAKRKGMKDSGVRMIGMEQLLAGVRKIDHADGNSLNNCRSNLRPATHGQNMMNRGKLSNNTSGFKGVYKYRTKWMALITSDKKRKHLGYFNDKIEAARSFDLAAVKYHGAFAVLNFPELIDEYHALLSTSEPKIL